jgi:aspartate aminotransferase
VLTTALRGFGYDVLPSEGAWYVLVRSPLPDDGVFADMLAAENVFVLPGRICELPGYLRISLTANDAMVDRSLQGFANAIAKAAASRRSSPVSREAVAMGHSAGAALA